MRILLTGSSGFVGRNLAAGFKSRSDQLLAPDSSELNLLNFGNVVDYLVEKKPQFIIHAAGRVGGIQANMRNPSSFLVDNAVMGFNLLTAAKSAGVNRVLNLGSSCMYPRNAPNPLQEDFLLTGSLEPTNEGYALGKIVVAKLGHYLMDENFACKTIMPSNLYGPYDHFDEDTGHLVASLIARLIRLRNGGASEITLWGSGKVRREFMYVEDLVDAIFFSIDRFDDLPLFFNCGVGHDYSIREYYDKAMKLIHYQPRVINDLSKPEGMEQKLVDSSLLRALGWEPRFSLEKGLQKTIEFYKEHHDRN